MAKISENDGRWIVEIDEGLGVSVTKSFASERRAKTWATRIERARAAFAQEADADRRTHTFGDLLDRYEREVTPTKKGARAEHFKVGIVQRSLLSGLFVGEVTPQAIAIYRDERLQKVSGGTVRIELALIRRVLEVARREWGYAIGANPAANVTFPPPGPARTRRLQPGEYEALKSALRGNPVVWAFVRCAIETAMRRGELLALRWRDVWLDMGVLHIPTSKNGSARAVALTDEAIQAFSELKRTSGYCFPIDEHALRWAWKTACEQAGIEGLRIHDLRHEGCSRLFELGLTLPEVQMMSGHRSPAMLMRYVHPQADRVRKKLAGLKRNF